MMTGKCKTLIAFTENGAWKQLEEHLSKEELPVKLETQRHGYLKLTLELQVEGIIYAN